MSMKPFGASSMPCMTLSAYPGGVSEPNAPYVFTDSSPPKTLL